MTSFFTIFAGDKLIRTILNILLETGKDIIFKSTFNNNNISFCTHSFIKNQNKNDTL